MIRQLRRVRCAIFSLFSDVWYEETPIPKRRFLKRNSAIPDKGYNFRPTLYISRRCFSVGFNGMSVGVGQSGKFVCHYDGDWGWH